MARIRRIPGAVLVTLGWLVTSGALRAQTYSVLHEFIFEAGAPYAQLIQASDGNFYGTTELGGAGGYGTAFRMDPSGTVMTLHSFTGGDDGGGPYASLIQASDGSFYGTTSSGGASGRGTVFRMESSGNVATLHSFTGSPSDGDSPVAALIQATDGNFYGMTPSGGAGNHGAVFRMDPSGNLTLLHSFAGSPSDGAVPAAGLIQASDGNFYGTTEWGGAGVNGTVFRMDSSGNVTVLHSFVYNDGALPAADLIQASDGNFYGTTAYGGAGSCKIAEVVVGCGTIFKMGSSGKLTPLHSFEGYPNDGAHPTAGLIQAIDGNFYGTTFEGGSVGLILGTVFKMDSSGNLTTLYNFTGGSDGASPYASLVQSTDGNFYGTAVQGSAGYGTTFRMDSSGNLTPLHSFGYSEGSSPLAGLVQASDGNFYGTTYYGGSSGVGTVFRMDSTGNLTTLHKFGSFPNDGAYPYSGLIQATDGNFYSTTSLFGGAGYGTVFRMDWSGNETTVHSFAGPPSDGASSLAALNQGSDGNLYGTTAGGGTGNFGTVFRMNASGNVTTLYSFTGGSDGGYPKTGLIQASDGNFYGTTGETSGGAGGVGTIFRLDASGNLTTLYSFTGGSDGGSPVGGLLQAADSDFYGTTQYFGGGGYGTVFRMDSSGNLTTLHSFVYSDGAYPVAGLIQASDGSFYGTTEYGGASSCGCGTVFRMDSSGNLTTIHSFAGSDGASPRAGLIQTSDGSFYGTASAGGPGPVSAGVVFKISPCSLAQLPVVSVAHCMPPAMPGQIASVSGNATDAYYWTVFGGTINGGQGTQSIAFTSGTAGTRLTVQVFETDSNGCVGAAAETVQVDFNDVPLADPFQPYVCIIGREGITAGCGGGNYCRDNPVTRAQMAVFLLKAEHGSSYTPPACAGIFGDVTCPSGFANWIEQLAAEGITAGCGGGLYCPNNAVTRQQMAVFLLKTKEGSSYTPPPAIGIFGDVPQGDTYAPWIEELYNRQITGGCQASPLLYCPGNPSTRGQMAVFLVRTFGLEP